MHVLCRTRSHDVNVSGLPGVSKHRQSSSRAVRQAMPTRWDRNPLDTRSMMLKASCGSHGCFATFRSSFLLFHIGCQSFLERYTTAYHSWNPSRHISRDSGSRWNRSICFCFHGSGRWGGWRRRRRSTHGNSSGVSAIHCPSLGKLSVDQASKDKGKGVHFNGVHIPPRKKPETRPSTVTEEIVSPELQKASPSSSGMLPISTSGTQRTNQPSALTSSTAEASGSATNRSAPSINIPPRVPPANQSSPPTIQYKYMFLLEDKSTPRQVLDWALNMSVPIPVKDLIAVSPEFRKQFWDLTMVKRVTNTSSNSVQVHELSALDPVSVSPNFGYKVHRNNDGLIVAHHSLLLQAIEVKIGESRHSVRGILDSGSEIVAMLKWIWEELRLPIRFDHTMNMSSTNTSIDTTLGVLENLVVNFGTGEVMVQVQILTHTNFDLLLGRPFHCLISANTEDFPDGSQTITLHDPNTGKQFALPTCPWSEGCLHCCEKTQCNSHKSVVEMGF